MTAQTPTGLPEASVLPLAVSDEVEHIADDAIQAAFKLIADRLAEIGYPVTGDISPDEHYRLKTLFQGFVLTMSLNNDTISQMQDGS